MGKLGHTIHKNYPILVAIFLCMHHRHWPFVSLSVIKPRPDNAHRSTHPALHFLRASMLGYYPLGATSYSELSGSSFFFYLPFRLISDGYNTNKSNQ